MNIKEFTESIIADYLNNGGEVTPDEPTLKTKKLTSKNLYNTINMKKSLLYCMVILMAVLVSVVSTSCGSDDDDEITVTKSELIGTWYTLEDGWVAKFTESDVTLYEIWQSSGTYLLNPYSITSKYTLSGNKFVDKDGQTYTIHSISGSTMRISNRGETLTLTKYNGTPQQLMDYLNK